jgi:YegS/Rv2252/BmrU family lipid kinase
VVTDRQPRQPRTGSTVEYGRADDRVVVLNPTSGDGEHTDRVHGEAAARGYEVRETAGEGDAVDLAAEAAGDGAEVVAAAGGDGTLNEVVRGLRRAEALPNVRFGLVPCGTGNNFAGNVGIESVPQAFTVLESGDERVIDLGFADGRPFLNSCIGGLTAEASAETTSEDKAEFGVLAYVLTTLRTAVEYDGLGLHVETEPETGQDWNGEAVMILVGNGRRFPSRGRPQANMEDGLLDVAIIEERPRFELAELAWSTAVERLFGGESKNVTRLQTPALDVQVLDEEPVTFSLDGELLESSAVHIETAPSALTLRVGEGYQPDPGP